MSRKQESKEVMEILTLNSGQFQVIKFKFSFGSISGNRVELNYQENLQFELLISNNHIKFNSRYSAYIYD